MGGGASGGGDPSWEGNLIIPFAVVRMSFSKK